MIHTLVRSILAVGLATTLLVAPATSASNQPNVVLIYADDLGYGDVGLYNDESKIPTPHMDDLGNEGVWLTDGHAPSATCSPSRYALLTGRYAWRRRPVGVLMPWAEPMLETERTTLPEALQSAGYRTALIGKWHLGFQWPWRDGQRPQDEELLEQGWISLAHNDQFDWTRPLGDGPLTHGFDYYYGDDVPNMPPYAWIENDRVVGADMVQVRRSALISVGFTGGIHGDGPGQPGWQLDQVMPALVDRSAGYIRQAAEGDEPFFLMVSLTAPHTPVVPTAEFDGTSEAGTYGDFVVQTDGAVGTIVETLKDAEIFDDTIVIVTSDNGPEFTAYRQWKRYDHQSMGSLRGLKSDTWEGGHRVPFIASWPNGGIEGGRRIDAVVSQVDLFATLAEAAGTSIGEGDAPDSEPLLATLRGQERSGRESLVYHGGTGNLGLREGDWVFLRGGGYGRFPLQVWEEPEWVRLARKVRISDEPGDQLYNLKRDPGQTRNVIKKHPKVAEDLREKLAAIEASDK